MCVKDNQRVLRVEKAASVLNGIFNPLLLCAFLPIIEGKSGLDLVSPAGFWGQLAVAVAIAQIVGALPLFGHAVGSVLGHFGLDEGPAGKVAGVIVGATLLFCIIGLGECVLTGGVGEVAGRGLFARWASLVCTGWAFVVVGGLLLDPVARGLAEVVVGK